MDRFRRMQCKVAYEAFTQGGKRLESVLQTIPVERMVGNIFDALKSRDVHVAAKEGRRALENYVAWKYKGIRNVSLYTINDHPCIMLYDPHKKSLRWIHFAVINSSNALKDIIISGSSIGKVIDERGNVDPQSLASEFKNVLKYAFKKSADPTIAAGNAYTKQYGDAVLNGFKTFVDSVKSDIEQLKASNPQAKQFASYFNPADATFEDLDFIAKYKFKFLQLGGVITGRQADFFFKEIDDDVIDQGLSGQTDADENDVRVMYHNVGLTIHFGHLVEKSVDKHIKTYIQSLRSAGLKPTKYGYDHMSGEFLYERLYIDLDSDFSV